MGRGEEERHSVWGQNSLVARASGGGGDGGWDAPTHYVPSGVSMPAARAHIALASRRGCVLPGVRRQLRWQFRRRPPQQWSTAAIAAAWCVFVCVWCGVVWCGVRRAHSGAVQCGEAFFARIHLPYPANIQLLDAPDMHGSGGRR